MWRERGFRGRVLNAGGRFGNTTSASIPLALALNPEELSVGRRFGLFGYGGGLSACFAFGTIRATLELQSAKRSGYQASVSEHSASLKRSVIGLGVLSSLGLIFGAVLAVV